MGLEGGQEEKKLAWPEKWRMERGGKRDEKTKGEEQRMNEEVSGQ